MNTVLLPSQLKAMRTAAAWSQTKLSLKAGVSRYKISTFECGYADISVEDQEKLVKALKTKTK